MSTKDEKPKDKPATSTDNSITTRELTLDELERTTGGMGGDDGGGGDAGDTGFGDGGMMSSMVPDM